MGELPELPKKYKLQEPGICWFCKMPADETSWRNLGKLRRTRTPIAEGRYIEYHEPCAVFSNGSGLIPAEGMGDEAILRFYAHGESTCGVGLKCKLCGKRGATFGCLHGPCNQVYHFPCARAMAYKGQVVFSLQSRDMACLKHTRLLERPHEENFLGMWMERGGGWNGMHMEAVEDEWALVRKAVDDDFPSRWQHLLAGPGGGGGSKYVSPRGGGSGGGGASSRRSSSQAISGGGGSGGGGGGSGGALGYGWPAPQAQPGTAGPPATGALGGGGVSAQLAAATAAVAATIAAAAGGAGAPRLGAAAPAAMQLPSAFAEIFRVVAGAAAPAQGALTSPLPAAAPAARPAPQQPSWGAAPPALSRRPGARPRKWASITGISTGGPARLSRAKGPSEQVHPDLPSRRGQPYTGPLPLSPPSPPPSPSPPQDGARKRPSLSSVKDETGADRGSKRPRSSGSLAPSPPHGPGATLALRSSSGGGGGAAAPPVAPGALPLPAGTAPDVAAMFNLLMACGKERGPGGQPDSRDLSAALAQALGGGGGGSGGGTAGALSAITALLGRQSIQQQAPAAPQQQQAPAVTQQQQQPSLSFLQQQQQQQQGAKQPKLPKLIQYSGFVSVLPPQQPGELRMLGLTVHPGLAARWLPSAAQPPVRPGGAHLSVPAAVSRQLLDSYGLRAEQLLLPQLRALIDTGSGGGGGGAGGVEGSDAGWMGLPQDLPTKLVEGCMVDKTDPRKYLRGELGLQALQAISPGTVLGPYRSYAMGQDTYLQLLKAVPRDWGGNRSAATRDHEWVELVHRYTQALSVPASACRSSSTGAAGDSGGGGGGGDCGGGGNCSGSGGGEGAEEVVYYCSLGYGNLMCLANDPTGSPDVQGPGPAQAAPGANAAVVLVMAGGLPVPFIVCVRPIEAGDEVMIDYGQQYWRAWRMLRRNTDAAAGRPLLAQGGGGPWP